MSLVDLEVFFINRCLQDMRPLLRQRMLHLFLFSEGRINNGIYVSKIMAEVVLFMKIRSRKLWSWGRIASRLTL